MHDKCTERQQNILFTIANYLIFNNVELVFQESLMVSEFIY